MKNNWVFFAYPGTVFASLAIVLVLCMIIVPWGFKKQAEAEAAEATASKIYDIPEAKVLEVDRAAGLVIVQRPGKTGTSPKQTFYIHLDDASELDNVEVGDNLYITATDRQEEVHFYGATITDQFRGPERIK